VVYEIWRDAQALTEHFLKPYAQRFVQEASDYESGDMRVQFLTMSSPYDPGRNARVKR
jgi:quinol monooxygenase YgiN